MSPEIGRRFGPYEIQSRLAGGGMGHVFRAWDARLHREVAVKLLNHEFTMPGMRERFLREARAASALNHPNICTIFDIGEQDGDPYLVMELLRGETLKDCIQGQTIPVAEIARIARETAEALGAAHAKGVIHRDIKPANIFLVEKPNGGMQAKVLDFGLAKIEGGALGTRGRMLDITTAGATVGTLAYMSPEQARGEVLDARSDLFSLGVVMYEMAARRVPFQGATSALVFVQLLNHPPEPVREWNEAVPRELEKIILKLLAKERGARFQTAHELELALLSLEKGSGGWLRKAVTAVPLVRAPDPVARERRLRDRHSSSAPMGEGGRVPTEHEPQRPEERAVPRRDSPVPSGREVAGRIPVPSNELLRPVARLPRADSTPPRPRAEVVSEASDAPGESSSAGYLAEANPTRSLQPETVEPESNPQVPAAVKLSSVESSRQTAAEGVQKDLKSKEGNADLAPEYIAPALFQDAGSRTKDARHRGLLLAGTVLVLLAAGVVAATRWMRHGQLGSAVLRPGDVLVVTEFENRTGAQVLDRSVAEGLRLALIQSPWLTLRGDAAWSTASQLSGTEAATKGEPALTGAALARRAAQRLGARAYLSGSVSGSSPYQIRAELLDTSSNDVLAIAQESAESLEQIPNALDLLANDIRTSAGEPRSSIEGSATALNRDASANLTALSAYGEAQQLFAAGKLLESLNVLARASAADPHFVQAHLRRAAILDQMHAEVAAAEAARLALAASEHTSGRTRSLARAVYALDNSDDLPQASSILRELLATYPRDSEAQTALARSLRLQGRFSDALNAAEQGYADDSLNRDAYSEAEAAMLGLDRYDTAFELDEQMQRIGLPPSGESILTAYLDGHLDAVARLADLAIHHPADASTYTTASAYALYLDNAGRLGTGAAVTREISQLEGRDEALASAAAALLSQGALTRALLGDCATALSLAGEATSYPEGRNALIHSGITWGLCGQPARANDNVALLRQRYPDSYSVASFAAADIMAAIAIHDQDPDTALGALRAARTADLISVTPYLRGLAHTQLQQAEIGIVDFQTVLSHRGSSLLFGGTVYPAAQAGIARAFAQSGDLANSADAWSRFLTLWNDAEPGSRLLLEAHAHAKP